MTVKTKVSPRELEPYDLDTPLRGAWRHKLKIKPVYDATLKVKTNGPTPRRDVTSRSSVNATSRDWSEEGTSAVAAGSMYAFVVKRS
jgi:hypothetical protein